MLPSDSTKLHFGPYRTPRFRYGAEVECNRRGRLNIVGLSNGRIQWPLGKRGSVTTLILFGALERAVRRESNKAVAYWWGVTGQTVTSWRKALDVDRTEGTSRLRSAYALEEPIAAARRKAWAKARDPERRRKIGDALRGRKRPRRLMAALIAGNRGRKPSAETRARMSAAHRRRGTRPPKAGRPWTADEDRLCRTLAIADAARETGRTVFAVKARRRELGVPDGRRRENRQ